MYTCVGLQEPSGLAKKLLQLGPTDAEYAAPVAISPRARPSNFDIEDRPIVAQGKHTQPRRVVNLRSCEPGPMRPTLWPLISLPSAPAKAHLKGDLSGTGSSVACCRKSHGFRYQKMQKTSRPAVKRCSRIDTWEQTKRPLIVRLAQGNNQKGDKHAVVDLCRRGVDWPCRCRGPGPRDARRSAHAIGRRDGC